jgi:hypothetical protein
LAFFAPVPVQLCIKFSAKFTRFVANVTAILLH